MHGRHAVLSSQRSDGIEIRTLGEADALAWWHLRWKALRNEPFSFGKSVEEHEATSVELTASRLRETPLSFTLGAFSGSALIGIATFMREDTKKERHKGRVFGVYVAPGFRRAGVGEALISALIAKAREDSSLEQILLAVTANGGAAERLYNRCGFETYGVEPRALKIGTEYADEKYMILRFAR